ncbi:MAG: hypothetical protein R3F61_38500 [Myxococcota bacterium]
MDAVRSQDVVVAAGLFALGQPHDGGQAALARMLEMPRSRVSESVRRLADNGLYSRNLRRLRHARLLDFLTNGARWMFPAEPGPVTRGVPTSHAGPVLNERIAAGQAYVWPSEQGEVEGRAVEPIHPSVVPLALALPEAYKLLSLLDAMRVGRARERRLAGEALDEMLR